MLLLFMVVKEGLSRYFIKLNNFNDGTINTNSNTHEYHTTFRDCRFTVAFFWGGKRSPEHGSYKA